MFSFLFKLVQRILKTVNLEVRHRSSNKLHSSLHTHKDRKHKNTQPGVYKIPCKCGKVYIGETGRIKEHKACQRLGDGDKSVIVKHAQQQQHNINWEDSSLITSIPHWHTRRVREAIEILQVQHNTVPQDSGLHINDIWYPLLQKRAPPTNTIRTTPQPQDTSSRIASPRSATNSTSSRFTHVCNQHTKVIHTPVIQSFSWGRSVQTDQNIETPSQPSTVFFRTSTWCYRKLHLIIWYNYFPTGFVSSKFHDLGRLYKNPSNESSSCLPSQYGNGESHSPSCPQLTSDDPVSTWPCSQA